jgi:hypothetical protein
MLLAADAGPTEPGPVAAAFRAAAVALLCACLVVTNWHCKRQKQACRQSNNAV